MWRQCVSVPRLKPLRLKHNWNVSEAEATAIQNRLTSFAVRKNEFGKIETIAGVDVAYDDTQISARRKSSLIQRDEMSSKTSCSIR